MSADMPWHWPTYQSDCHSLQVAAARHMYQMQVEEMLPYVLPQLAKRSQEHQQHQLTAKQALLEEHHLYNTRVCVCTPACLTLSLHMLCEQSLKTLTSAGISAPDILAQPQS